MYTYELTAKGKKVSVEDLKGQPALILPELAKGAVTVAEIAERVGKKLDTRQKPELVIRHYMATWKRNGWVRVRGGK